MFLVPFEVSLTWRELIRRTIHEINDDDCLNLAAQLSYYFFLALFPAVLFLLAIASFFPLTHVTDNVVRTLSPFAPPDVIRFLQDQITRISDSDNGGILTIGFLGAIWSSSAALVAICNSLNRAYDIDEGRPWWKVRIIAVLLTIALAFFLLLSFTLILAGPTIAEYLTRTFGLGGVFEWGWKILQWPLAFVMVSTAIGLVYYFAPDAEQDWKWITPGAVTATILWILVSLGFKLYVAKFEDYNATYGAVGGVIALLLWFYNSGLAILIGAEMNAEIEHASVHGKAAGEKFPGARRKLGSAAARAYKKELMDKTRASTSRRERSEDTRVAAHALEVGTIMPARQDDRTIGEMFAELSRDFKTLVHQEVQLAQVELTQKASRMRKGLVLIVGGSLLAYAAFLTVVAAIVLALAATGLPAWLAALVAAVVLGGVGYVLVHSGITSLRPQDLTPTHTIETLKEDAQWLRTQAK